MPCDSESVARVEIEEVFPDAFGQESEAIRASEKMNGFDVEIKNSNVETACLNEPFQRGQREIGLCRIRERRMEEITPS